MDEYQTKSGDLRSGEKTLEELAIAAHRETVDGVTVGIPTSIARNQRWRLRGGRVVTITGKTAEPIHSRYWQVVENGTRPESTMLHETELFAGTYLDMVPTEVKLHQLWQMPAGHVLDVIGVSTEGWWILRCVGGELANHTYEFATADVLSFRYVGVTARQFTPAR